MNVEKLKAQDDLVNAAQVIGNKEGGDFAFVISSVSVNSEKGRVGIVVSGNGESIVNGLVRAMEKDSDIAGILMDATDNFRMNIARSRKTHTLCDCPACTNERAMQKRPDIKPQ